MTVRPTLRAERALMRQGYDLVAGIDEVGRGAIAGPVSVGIVLVGAATRTAPVGLRDSKLLTPLSRARLAPKVARWATSSAVGHSQCWEVDAFGLTAALRLAALRALQECPTPDVIILDGSHDWLSQPAEALFEMVPWPEVTIPPVTLLVKADRTCSSVAGASVVAKVARDAIMGDLHRVDGRYEWLENKGYTTEDHAAGIRIHGLSEHHRKSWDIAAAIDLRPAMGSVIPTTPARMAIPS